MAIALRYAALSDIGLVRSNNQDSGYAGPRLLVIADGMGGHAGGDVASSLAIGEMAFLDDESHGPDVVMENLSRAMHAAHRELLERVAEEPALSGMGTTVTALLRTGGRLALAHIGDSRAYVLRDGELTQITRDHTFVQRLVDDGRITIEEAEQHPQRSVLMRVLSDVVDDVEPDLSMREARIGDRYLLCSDGLSSVVSHDTLEQTVAAGADPGATCEQLVQLALRSGAPDNVTCIVADVVDTATASTETVPIIVGSAAIRQQPRQRTIGNSPAERAAQLTGARPGEHPAADEPAAADEEPSPGRRFRQARFTIGALVVVLVLVVGGFGAYRWSQGQYFVGKVGNQPTSVVAIYRGLPQNLGPITLSSVTSKAGDVPVVKLPLYFQRQIAEGIVAKDEQDAHTIVSRLHEELCTTPQLQSTAAADPGASADTGVNETPTGSAGTATSAAASASSAAPTSASASATPVPGNPLEDCQGQD